ncbi:MAG: NPCBM/NEW2 domain-containing protein [Pirellulales bacterium]|nr:NPCBM/NEW2 domain-containing protein [Pirellulales bacterium]
MRSTLLLTTLFFAASRFVVAGEVTATRLDGTAASGILQSWDADWVVLSTASGDQRFAVKELISLRWPNAQVGDQPPPSSTSGIVELVDGTVLPWKSLAASGENILLASAGTEGGTEISLPVANVGVVRFLQLEGPLIEQWNEIRQQALPSDVLVVLKRDGKSLDYVEGVVGNIADDKIDFKLDGESNRVDRAKVAGVFYFRKARPETAKPAVVLQGQSGLRANAASVRMERDHLAIKTLSGDTLVWPVEDLASADYSAGKLVYLSDLEPTSAKWASFVGLPSGVELASTYGEPRRDRSGFGDSLMLFSSEAASDPAQRDKLRTFSKGLALRSRTEIAYRLPSGFSRFTAEVGVDPIAAARGSVKLTISADDERLLEADFTREGRPQSIDLPIAGAKRLHIVVDYGQNLDSGDWLNLCDAKLIQ